jgi:hypothetical protein
LTETTDIEAAAEMLIRPEPETEEVEETQDAPETDDVEEDAAEVEAEDDTTEDGDEAEADDPDEEDDSTEETDGDETPETFTVKVNGEEVQATLDDLKRAFSGQEYIQKGMQEAATKRKEAEEIYSQLQAQQQQFVQTVQQLQQEGFKQAPTPPDDTLIGTDPIGYMQDKARYERELSEYQSQQAQIQAVRQHQTQAEQQARQAYLQEQRDKMVQLVPELGDAEKAPEFEKRLAKIGAEAYGFSVEELAQVSDARHVSVLADAMKWRELQAGQDKAKAKPKPTRNVKPTGRRQQPQAVQRRDQKAQAKKSGRLEDFAALLLDPSKNG